MNRPKETLCYPPGHPIYQARHDRDAREAGYSSFAEMAKVMAAGRLQLLADREARDMKRTGLLGRLRNLVRSR